MDVDLNFAKAVIISLKCDTCKIINLYTANLAVLFGIEIDWAFKVWHRVLKNYKNRKKLSPISIEWRIAFDHVNSVTVFIANGVFGSEKYFKNVKRYDRKFLLNEFGKYLDNDTVDYLKQKVSQ